MGERLRPMATALALGFLALCAACTKDARAYLESDRQYAERGQWREVVVEYRNAVARDPALGDAHARLAEAYLKVGNRKGAPRNFPGADEAREALKNLAS
jgi:Tfp pilus assembly protein PilF